MPNYDFKTLSPIDFELLVRDLLQEELKIRLESFKAGRDGGIDLRYSKDGSETIIVQCKHYAESSFTDLFRHLRDSEPDKAIIELIESLEAAKICEPNDNPEFYGNAKELLKTDLWRPDQFKPWVKFMGLHAELVTRSDHQNVMKQFEDYLSSEIDDNNPDSVRQEADDVSEIGSAYQINVSERVKSLREYADELEADAPSEGDDMARYERGILSADYCSDAEVDSIFNNLQ